MLAWCGTEAREHDIDPDGSSDWRGDADRRCGLVAAPAQAGYVVTLEQMGSKPSVATGSRRQST